MRRPRDLDLDLTKGAAIHRGVDLLVTIHGVPLPRERLEG
jgi:hypothetical protein